MQQVTQTLKTLKSIYQLMPECIPTVVLEKCKYFNDKPFKKKQTKNLVNTKK